MVSFYLTLSKNAEEQLDVLKADSANPKRYKAVIKALRLLEQNPKHPSLNTHEFSSLSRKYGIKIYEAYAENNTPGAYRIFWYYTENKGEIAIILITPHP